jgi:soluble lytic murein transglycosylase-like protein
MRSPIARGPWRAPCVALTGLAVAGLVVLTALQPVPQNGRPRVDAFAVKRVLSSASAASASASGAATASAAAAPSPSSTAASTAPATLFGTEAFPSPVPALIVPSPTLAPTPPPAPAAPQAVAAAPATASYSVADVEAILTNAAQSQGVDPSWLVSTAKCESNLNPNAVNPSGPYEGILQFLPSTFLAHGGTDIWDPTQQAQIAATMFANGESGEWPVCSR